MDDGPPTGNLHDSYFANRLSHEVDVIELRRLIVEAGPAIVDARPEAAFMASHIPGAINLQPHMIDAATASHFLPDGLQIICYADADSLGAVRAAAELSKLGYSVRVLLGGFGAWRGAKYRVEGINA